MKLAMATGVLVTSLFGAQTAFAKSYDDYVPEDIQGHWAEQTLDDMVAADYLSGYTNSKGVAEIRPDKTITRAEFTSILVRILNLKTDGPGKTFSDVKSGKWYTDPIRIASELNLISGVGEGKFAPDAEITRGEMAALLTRAYKNTIGFTNPEKSFTDVPDYWGKQAVIDAAKMGLIGGYSNGTFKPKNKATRAEASSMLQRAIKKETSNVVTDDVIKDVVESSLDKYFSVYNSGNYNEMENYLNTYTTGYYREAERVSHDDLMFYIDSGATVNMELLTTPSVTVIEKSNKFASVELTDATFNISVTEDGETIVDDNGGDGYALDGEVSLKLMPDGTWKIYNILTYE